MAPQAQHPVARYLNSKRGDGYVEARACILADDHAVDDATLRAFFAKALAQLPAAASDLDGFGPRAFAAYRDMAAPLEARNPWCSVLRAVDLDDARAAAPLLRRAEYAAHVPDGGDGEARSAIRALAAKKAVVRAIVDTQRRMPLGVPTGWLAVLLQDGGADAVAALDAVVERLDDDATRAVLDYLLSHAPAKPTLAAGALVARLRAATTARHDEHEHPLVLAALGLDAYPDRCQVYAHWSSTSGHALSITVERHGPTDPPSWWMSFGKKRPVLRASTRGQHPNKYGVPMFAWSTFAPWLTAVEARFETAFNGPIDVSEHGFPHPVKPHLVAFLASLRPATSKGTKKAAPKKTPRRPGPARSR